MCRVDLCGSSTKNKTKNSPHTSTYSFSVSPCTYYFDHIYCTSPDSIYTIDIPPRQGSCTTTFCMPSPLNYYFLFTCLVFLVKSEKCGPTNLSAIRIKIFSKASFFFHYPTHSVFTFCLPRNLLFVYLQHPKYPFCLPSYSARPAKARRDTTTTTRMAMGDDDNDRQ